jgi:hypothetical protein
MVVNLKQADISIVKFSKGTREVRGVHSSYNYSVNNLIREKGATIEK